MGSSYHIKAQSHAYQVREGVATRCAGDATVGYLDPG